MLTFRGVLFRTTASFGASRQSIIRVHTRSGLLALGRVDGALPFRHASGIDDAFGGVRLRIRIGKV